MEETPDAYQAGYDQARWEERMGRMSQVSQENRDVRDQHTASVLTAVEGLVALRNTTADMSDQFIKAIIRKVVNSQPIEKDAFQ